MDIVSKTDALRFVKPKFTNSARARACQEYPFYEYSLRRAVFVRILFLQNKTKKNKPTRVGLFKIYIHIYNELYFVSSAVSVRERLISFVCARDWFTRIETNKKKHEMKARNIRGKQKKNMQTR